MDNDGFPRSPPSQDWLPWLNNPNLPSAQTPTLAGPSSEHTDGPETLPPTQLRSPTQLRRPRRLRRKRRSIPCPGQQRKLFFLTHLLKSLDMVVFAELSALYYMECSMPRFLSRVFIQLLCLSPKDESFPVALEATRIHVLLVIIPNIICIALHLLTALPLGLKDQRGYQHGGLVIDFIGQRPSTSRIYYLVIDIFLFILQCVMLTIHTERERMRVALKTYQPLAVDIASQMSIGRTMRALDEEERGIEEADQQGYFDLPTEFMVETAPRNRSRTTTSDEDEQVMTPLSNIMNSGNAVLGPYHVLHTMRCTAFNLQLTAQHSLRSVSYNTTFAAIRARARRRAVANLPTTTPVLS